MSITITSPTNNSTFQLKVPVTFKGRADGGIVKVELFAEQFDLGSATVQSGDWEINFPGFNQSGLRRIRAVGLDSNGSVVASSEINLVISNSSGKMEPGIDVSNFDQVIDWHKVKSAGFSFAIAKATEGETFRDAFFADNWRKIQAVGMIRGAFHFFRPAKDPTKQANNFLNLINSIEPIQPEDLPPVLDLEPFPQVVRNEWQALSKAERVKRVRTWIDVVEGETKRQVMIYTTFGFWTEFMSGVKDFADHPLWVAHFTTKPKPLIPNEWKEKGFKIWQFSDTTEVPGIPTPNEDGDHFNGSLADLLAFIPTTIIT
jgi:lysozyme